NNLNDMAHITIVDVDSREKERHPEGKEKQPNHWNREINPCPVQRKPQYDDQQHQWDQRKQEVDDVGNHGRNRKDQRRYADFLKQFSITNDRLNRIRQSLREECPWQKHTEQEYRVVGNGEPHQRTENHREDQHHQQWIQQRPNESENG